MTPDKWSADFGHIRVDRSAGSRSRHRCSHTRAHVRTIFHHQASRQGNGLGLALVLSIAQRTAEVFALTARPDGETSFRVYLPAADATPDAPAVSAGVPRGQDETILIVDDEAALRDLAAEILVSLGYQVACYANASQALVAVTSGQVRPDAVLTDEVMPDMTGTQLTTELRNFQIHAAGVDRDRFRRTRLRNPRATSRRDARHAQTLYPRQPGPRNARTSERRVARP